MRVIAQLDISIQGDRITIFRTPYNNSRRGRKLPLRRNAGAGWSPCHPEPTVAALIRFRGQIMAGSDLVSVIVRVDDQQLGVAKR